MQRAATVLVLPVVYLSMDYFEIIVDNLFDTVAVNLVLN